VWKAEKDRFAKLMLLFQHMRKPDFNIFAHLWNEEDAKDDIKMTKSTASATSLVLGLPKMTFIIIGFLFCSLCLKKKLVVKC
jgi:hypothetical protein